MESPHPHPPYQPLHAAEDAAHTAVEEEARHNVVEEAAQADTPRETEPDTPGDSHTPTDSDNPDEIQDAPDTPTPHTHAPDNAAHAGTVSGPPSGMDPSVMSIPPATLTLQVSCPPLSFDRPEAVMLASPSMHYQ